VGGRYRLLRVVGSGGMGQVWLARDELLHREVAVKEVNLPAWLTDGERDDLRARTLREARSAARLTHPGVVRVYDVVDDDGPWIVMEYVPSRSLQELLEAEGPLPPRRAAEIGLAVLGALRAAHRAGVLHRDVKPGNVLVADDGRVMLTDFGLATADGDVRLTRTGMILGSPQYVAPERITDSASTPEGDLWSLGACLYTAVEGRSPYGRSTPMATLAALATAPPDPVTRAGPLTPVLDGLLRRDPRLRLTAAEVDRMLRRVLTPPTADDRDLEGPTERLEVSTVEIRPETLRRVTLPRPAGADPAAGGSSRRSAARLLLLAAAVVLVLVTVAATLAAVRSRTAPDGSPGTAGAQSPAGLPDPGWRGPGGPDRPPPGPDSPPPFDCRPPPPDSGRGRFTTAGPVPPGRSALPEGWAWHTDPAGFQIGLPVGWEAFSGDGVSCFHEPHGPRLVVVDPSPGAGDPDGYWRLRRDQLRAGGVTEVRMTGTAPVRRGRSTEWEYRWTGPEQRPLHTVEMLFSGGSGRAFVVVWQTVELDWTHDQDRLAVLRRSFTPLG
jgi:hypothetical protein